MDHAKRKSVFELPPDNDAEVRLDAQADAEIDAGQGVPHERVRDWLTKLGRGEKVRPPIA